MTAKPKLDIQEQLAGVAPRPAGGPAGAIRAADDVGDRLGFASREASAQTRLKRKIGTTERVEQMSFRAEVPDINRFVDWCERHRMSYREAFGRLVAKIDD